MQQLRQSEALISADILTAVAELEAVGVAVALAVRTAPLWCIRAALTLTEGCLAHPVEAGLRCAAGATGASASIRSAAFAATLRRARDAAPIVGRTNVDPERDWSMGATGCSCSCCTE